MIKAKSLLGIEHLEPIEIYDILDSAQGYIKALRFKEKLQQPLNGRSIINIFFENLVILLDESTQYLSITFIERNF